MSSVAMGVKELKEQTPVDSYQSTGVPSSGVEGAAETGNETLPETTPEPTVLKILKVTEKTEPAVDLGGGVGSALSMAMENAIHKDLYQSMSMVPKPDYSSGAKSSKSKSGKSSEKTECVAAGGGCALTIDCCDNPCGGANYCNTVSKICVWGACS